MDKVIPEDAVYVSPKSRAAATDSISDDRLTRSGQTLSPSIIAQDNQTIARFAQTENDHRARVESREFMRFLHAHRNMPLAYATRYELAAFREYQRKRDGAQTGLPGQRSGGVDGARAALMFARLGDATKPKPQSRTERFLVGALLKMTPQCSAPKTRD